MRFGIWVLLHGISEHLHRCLGVNKVQSRFASSGLDCSTADLGAQLHISGRTKIGRARLQYVALCRKPTPIQVIYRSAAVSQSPRASMKAPLKRSFVDNAYLEEGCHIQSILSIASIASLQLLSHPLLAQPLLAVESSRLH